MNNSIGANIESDLDLRNPDQIESAQIDVVIRDRSLGLRHANRRLL